MDRTIKGKGRQVDVDPETPSSALSLSSSSEGETFAPPPPTKQGPPAVQSWIPAKSWVHFVAGGLGGMCGAVVTAPFDVAKTRLQSDLFGSADPAQRSATAATEAQQSRGRTRRLLYHFVETGRMLKDIGRNEGLPALFRGLGPTLVGVIPARSINFFSYGNGKRVLANALNDGRENAAIHLAAAATAGVITATATNPIWVVKTRLQLQDSAATQSHWVSGAASPVAASSSKMAAASTLRAATAAAASSSSSRVAPYSSIASSRSPATARLALFNPSFARTNASVASSSSTSPPVRFASSLQCISHIWRHEGISGFYRGLSASYLGVAEGTIQWTLYEQFKALRRRQGIINEEGWVDKVGAAGAAKLIATMITYPHEVIRTRLRQPPPSGSSVPKYRGLVQTFNLILKEEGAIAFYNGLSPHLLRVVPNAAVMYTIYEFVIKYANA